MPADAAAGIPIDQGPRRDIVGQEGWNAALSPRKRGFGAPSRPVTEPLLDCTKFHSLALCRTLRQAICTGRMGLRALDAFEGPGVEVAKAGGEGPAVGMWNERSHSLTHPANPPDSPSPSRLTRPASCPSPRHPAGSEAGRIWHLPSPIRAVRARAINHHPVSITQTLYMDRANTRLPTSRDHGP